MWKIELSNITLKYARGSEPRFKLTDFLLKPLHLFKVFNHVVLKLSIISIFCVIPRKEKLFNDLLYEKSIQSLSQTN